MLKRGDTVLLRKPGTAIEHLWIVLTDAEPASGLAAIVNVTSLQSHRNPDQTVVLKRGDHPFISHDSIIFYQDARTADLRLIEQGINQGSFSQHAVCSEVLIKKICEGLLVSKHTPKKVISYCRLAWGG